MKSLVEYLIESSQEKKSFVFDFAFLENGEDAAKKFDGMDCVSVSGSKVTVSACDSCDCDFTSVIDTIQSVYDEAHKSTKRTSSEEYAQKLKTIKNSLDALKDFVNPDEGPADNADDDDKDDDKSHDDDNDEEEHDDDDEKK